MVGASVLWVLSFADAFGPGELQYRYIPQSICARCLSLCFCPCPFFSLCRNLHADLVCLARSFASICRLHPRSLYYGQLRSHPSEGFSVYPSNFGPSVSPPSQFRPYSSFLSPQQPQGLLSPPSLPDVLQAQPSSPGELVFIMRAHDRFEHVLQKLFLRFSKSSPLTNYAD